MAEHDDVRRGMSGPGPFRDQHGYGRATGQGYAGWLGGRDEGQGHRGRGPRGYRRSDQRIEEEVNDRLTDDPLLDASEIQVHVHDSEVTLTGNVDSRDARRRAEDLAEQVSGVTYVMNNLRVRQHGTSGATG
jgi:BON domain